MYGSAAAAAVAAADTSFLLIQQLTTAHPAKMIPPNARMFPGISPNFAHKDFAPSATLWKMLVVMSVKPFRVMLEFL